MRTVLSFAIVCLTAVVPALRAKEHFPGAVQIVDLYPARQHLWELARLLYPNDAKRQNAWTGLQQKRWLDKGKIDKLVASLRSIHVLHPMWPTRSATKPTISPTMRRA